MGKHPSNIVQRYWMGSIVLKTTSESIILPFLPLYGLVLNASLPIIGLLVAVNSLFGLAQIGWARFAEKKEKLRVTALITNYCSALFYFIFAGLPSIVLLIVFRALQSLIGSGFYPTSSALLTKRTFHKDWGYWNSWIQASTVAGTLIGILVGGYILKDPTVKSYYVLLFILAGAISLLSAILFHLAVPSQKKMELKHKWFVIEEDDVSLDNVLSIMRTDKNFVLLCLATFVLVLGTNISGPFYIIFNTRYYDLSVMKSSILTAIGLIPQLITSLLTYTFLGKFRKKEFIILTGVMFSAFPIIYITPYATGHQTDVFNGFIVLWILNGAAWGIANTSYTTLVLDIIHPRRRALQLAINNSVTSISLFLAPIIGGLIVEHLEPFYWIFIISAIVRLIGVTIFKHVQEPIIGGTILRPLKKIFHLPMYFHLEKTELLSNLPVTHQAARDMLQSKFEKTKPLPNLAISQQTARDMLQSKF